MNRPKFAEWLQWQLDERDWNMSDLGRASGMDPAVFSNIMAGKRRAGVDSCKAIARALRVPVEQVFQAAGLLPPKPEENKLLKQISHNASQLSVEEQKDLLEYIRLRLRIAEKKAAGCASVSS